MIGSFITRDMVHVLMRAVSVGSIDLRRKGTARICGTAAARGKTAHMVRWSVRVARVHAGAILRQ
jgi:hypothetical protein